MNSWQLILTQINLLIFFLVYIVISRKTNHFRFNRMYLLITPVLACILPFIYLQSSSQSEIFSVVFEPIEATVDTLKNEPIMTTDFLFLGYVLGFSVSFAFLLHSFFRVFLIKTDELLMVTQNIKIYRVSKTNSFSFFNTIYINDRQVNELEYIVAHEMEHVKQRHTLDLLLFGILKCVLWFNPIVFFWNKRIKENHEFLADEGVLKNQNNWQAYAQTILDVHLNGNFPQLGNGFNSPSLLRRRIEKMKHINKSYMKHLTLIPVLAIGLYLTTSSNLNGENSVGVNAFVLADDEVVDPEFPGGNEALAQFIAEKLKYPESMVRINATGTAYVELQIKEDGTVANPKILRGTGHEELDYEALRVVKLMPKWNPGKKNGKSVNTIVTLPFKFKLD